MIAGIKTTRPSPWTPERILAVCERQARQGECFYVHRFKRGAESLRRQCARLTQAGKLVQVRSNNPMLAYHRPEDVPVMEAAHRRHAEAMKGVHAQNVLWHLAQAEKNAERYPLLSEHHLREAERERALSI